MSLARTLLTSPKVLLADEVDAGLDDENADKVASIMAQAAERGMAVIRIRHRPPDGVPRAFSHWPMAYCRVRMLRTPQQPMIPMISRHSPIRCKECRHERQLLFH